jgi:hypothetical protein
MTVDPKLANRIAMATGYLGFRTQKFETVGREFPAEAGLQTLHFFLKI